MRSSLQGGLIQNCEHPCTAYEHKIRIVNFVVNRTNVSTVINCKPFCRNRFRASSFRNDDSCFDEVASLVWWNLKQIKNKSELKCCRSTYFLGWLMNVSFFDETIFQINFSFDFYQLTRNEQKNKAKMKWIGELCHFWWCLINSSKRNITNSN